MGSVVFAPVAVKLMPSHGVLGTFSIFGVVFALGIIISSIKRMFF
jgi:hypothetical protein